MSEFAPVTLDERGAVQFGGGDARLFVRFVKRSRRNAYKSELEGRPIFEPADFIIIQQPGERDNCDRLVKEDDKLRFPRQWAAYQADTEQVPEGTPIQMLFPAEPHIVDLLRDLKILTIEQLAGLTEHAISRLGMDGRKYVQRAQAALDASANNREVTRLNHELRDAQDRVTTLEQANKSLIGRLDAMEAQLHAQREPQSAPVPQAPPLHAEPPRHENLVG